MLWDGLYCLMVQQVSLNDRMRNVLLAAATGMMRRQGEKDAGRRRVKDDDIEGVLKTEFKSASLGCFAGIEFHAEVETDLGKGKVKFIADACLAPFDPNEIEKVYWVDLTDSFRKAEAAANN